MSDEKTTVIVDPSKVFELACRRRDRLFADREKYDKAIDERFRDIILEFNKIPNLVSIFCCSKHTPEEMKVKYPNYRAVETAGYAYIVFICMNDANELTKAYRAYEHSLDNETYQKLRPKLTLTMLRDKNGDETRYDTYSIYLKIDFKDPDAFAFQQTQWMKLIECLKEMNHG